jgi:signal transduction histidine kinase
LSSEIEQEKLLSKLMEVVMENAGAKKAALILPQNDTWLIEAYTTTESETKVMQSLPLNQYQDIAVAPIYYVIHAQERLVLDYAISSTSFASDSYIIQVQPQSLLVNPIFNQGKLIGILYLENHSTPGVFTQDRLEILNLICTQVAISLSNARLYTLEQEKSQQLYEKAQLLSFRTAIDSTLTQSEILTEMLQQCCQEIVNYLDAAFARIWTLNTQENVLELEASAGMYTHTNGGHSRIPVGKYKIGLIAQERLPHLTNNVQTDPRIGDREWAKREGMVGFAGYPLIIGGQLVGVLAVFTRHQIADNVLETLAFIARQIALGIKRKRNEAEINQKSIELSQALQDLQLAQLQLVQNEKMSALGNLVAGVAHEINNPVGFISGNILPAYEGVQDLFNLIDLYQENFPNPGSVIESEIETIDLEYLRADLPKLIYSMKEGVQRIRDISNSLRTFSRADTDYKVSFNIHDGLDSTILILKHRLKANENRPAIEIIKNYGNLPLIECFPGQLNQVFMNLLANAIDALEESNTGRSFAEIKDNPNCITITTKLTDDSKVNISIQDNGVGMSEEVKQKIFDHLYTTKIVGKGTGLGLAIVQQIIIDKHGGSIDVNSILGEGAEFLITIPLR